MPIQEQIVFEMKQCMKNNANPKLRDFLRVVMGEFAREGKELTDEQALAVMKKMKKNAIELEDEYEIAVLTRWVPEELGQKQTEILVAGVINSNKYSGMKDMGKVMAELKHIKNLDMKLAGELARKALQL